MGVGVTPVAGSADAAALPAAVRAFDAVAPEFDRRFGDWLSVAAQRRAVRRYMESVFPAGSHLLELGGGTGTDAVALARIGYRVLCTDGSPQMLAAAERNAAAAGCAPNVETRWLLLENLARFAAERHAAGLPPLDGAYSNFAALNCVADVGAVARGLAALLPLGASALLVVFGPLPAGEVILQLLRGHRRTAFRRLSPGDVRARLGGRVFTVRYPRPRSLAERFAPYFRLARMRGIGIFVPPSAAEPAISRWPRLVGALERLDRVASGPLALLGDHVLLHFVRTAEPAP